MSRALRNTPRMPKLAAALALAGCLAGSSAFGGTNVKGTLWLSAGAREASRHAEGTAAQQQKSAGEGVVWVEKIPAEVERALADPPRGWFVFWKPKADPPLPRVGERDDRFSPRVLAVPAGTSVEFANRDRLYHSAFSVSGAKRFDLGKAPPGRRDTLEFGRAGVVNLHCEIHPKAVGYVVVTPNRAYATPDASGRFRLPRLPAGRYVLHAWHPRLGELSLPFNVPRRGTVELNPTF